jgi:hypothetical protein
VEERKDDVVYFDCKTGNQQDSHRLQVQLYMWLDRLEGLHPGKNLRGFIVYDGYAVTVSPPPEGFGDDVAYFLEIVLGEEHEALKSAGRDCERCDIMGKDCADRDQRWP